MKKNIELLEYEYRVAKASGADMPPFFWYKVKATSFIECSIVETNFETPFIQSAVLLIVDSDNEENVGRSFSINQNTHFMRSLPLAEASGMLQTGALLHIKIETRGNPLEIDSRITKIQFAEKTLYVR